MFMFDHTVAHSATIYIDISQPIRQSANQKAGLHQPRRLTPSGLELCVCLHCVRCVRSLSGCHECTLEILQINGPLTSGTAASH